MKENEKLIKPSEPVFTYSGRIDFDEIDAPVFVYPCSSIRFILKGNSCRVMIENIKECWENALGILLDGMYMGKIVLQDTGCKELDISGFLDGYEHEVTIFKRQDSCHEFIFRGLIIQREADIKKALPGPNRRMEVYEDSVSAGEVSEAVAYVGLADPENNGEYSNSYYSYSWVCARKLNAQIHDIAQGGISLLDHEGYFMENNQKGMLSCFDKIEYHPRLKPVKEWDFSKYIPHVVIVAIGQNDTHPVNYMGEDYDGEHAKTWRKEYQRFISILCDKYPNGEIILTTTILCHDAAWDKAIEEVTEKINDKKVHHFLYSNNGCGTKGHIRIPEAEKMADELAAFIESLGDEVWEIEHDT